MDAKATTLKPIQVPEREAARLVGVSTKTLFNERVAKRLKFGRVGAKIVYRLDELDRWSQAQQVSGPVAR